MATRTISTKLAITGEAEYKAALSRINNELKALQSGLKLSESSFKGQANSIEALTSKGEALAKLQESQAKKVSELAKAFENAQKAVEQYKQRKEELIQKLADNEKALEDLKQSAEDTTEAENRLTKENESLNKELASNETYLNAAQKGANDWQTQLNNAQTELNDLNGAINDNNRYLNEAQNSADNCANSIDEFGNSIKDSKDAAQNLQEALGAAGLLAALKAVADGLRACIDSSIEFESAMAGVAKTTDMSDTELNSMAGAFKDLSTEIPATATEIATVAEAAGQLGIKKEDIVKFSEVMVNLGVATNLSSEEAASSLAKFANVVGMSSQNYDRLGSTIVALGNNFATTEADIVSMATRLASSGSIIGLSEAEIMGVSTALSSLGIEAEAGGSAISTLLKKFEVMVKTNAPALQDFAAVAGMSAQDFSKAWGENAVNALSAFIDGLGKVDAAGGSSVAVLDELGLKEIRLSNAVLSMASSQGILKDAVNLANQAWNDNTALQEEAETRYNTTESKLQMLQNAFTNVKIAIGDQLSPTIRDFATVGTEALSWIADFIEKNDSIVPIVTSVVVALGTFTGAIGAYVAITKIAAAVQAAFNAVALANPYVLLAAAIGGVVAALGFMVTSMKNEAIPSVKELTTAASDVGKAFDDAEENFQLSADSFKGSADLARDYVTRLKELADQGLKTKDAQREYATTVELLNTLIPDLNLTINEQTGLLDQNTDSILAQIDAWEEYSIKQALLEKFKTGIKAYSDAEAELYVNVVKQKDAENDLNEIRKKKTETILELNKLEDDAQIAAQNHMKTTGELTDSSGFLTEKYDELKGKLADLNQQEADAVETNDNLKEAIENGRAVVEEYKGPVDEAASALQAFEEEQAKAAETTGQTSETISASQQAVDELSDKINALAEAYVNATDSAKQSFDSQFGLFEKVEETASTSISTMQEALNTQEEYWTRYTEVVESLTARNVEGIEGLVGAIADGSPESLAQLEAMASGTDTELSKMVESFAKLDGLKSKLSETVGGMSSEVLVLMDQLQIDFTDKVKALGGENAVPDFSVLKSAVETAIGEVKTSMETGGKDAADGFKSGIEDNAQGAADAATNMGQGVIDATKDVLDSHSPSQVMHDIGKDVTDGLKEGIEDGAQDAVGAIEDMGDDLKDKAETAGKETVDSFIDEFKEITSRTQSEIDELKGAFDALDSLPDEMETLGGDIVDGMITGIQNNAGRLYDEISSIVSAAMEQAKAAADSHSPSKKMIRLFEDVGEGMIVGLEKKRRKVKETAQDVVNKALEIDTRNYTAFGDILSKFDVHNSDIAGRIHAGINLQNQDPVMRMLSPNKGSGDMFNWMFGGKDAQLIRTINKGIEQIIDFNSAEYDVLTDKICAEIDMASYKSVQAIIDSTNKINLEAVEISEKLISQLEATTRRATEEMLMAMNSGMMGMTPLSMRSNEMMSGRSIETGDIIVELTISDANKNNAAEIGRTIGTEIKRQLRYKGVV